MKKWIFCFFIFSLLIQSVKGFCGDDSVYVPLDNLKVPELGSQWKVKLGDDNTRVEYIRIPDKGMEGGTSKSSVELIREPLEPQAQKWPGVWQGEVRRDLNREFKGVETKKLDGSSYEADYSYTKDLIPVSGHRFYFSHDRFIYEWRCELEKNFEWDPEKWCLDQFQAIQWPGQIAVNAKIPPPTFENFIKTLPLDADRLRKIEGQIFSDFQEGEITVKKLQAYGYFLIFKSLFFPPIDSESKMVLLENLDSLADTLRPYPESQAMADWLHAQRRYLEGNLSYKEIEDLVNLDKMPPYWLMALWVQPVNVDTAVYLARRQVARLPVHNYVLGKVLLAAGKAYQAIPFLKKASRQGNILAMNTLANSYLRTQQFEKAKKTASATVRKAPGNIDSWLLLALTLSKEEKESEKVEKIYDDLVAREDLSSSDRIKIYLQRAQNSENPLASLSWYEEVLNLDPGNLESLYAAGRIYVLEKDDKSEGLKLFQRYLDTASRGDEKVSELVRMVRDLRVEIHGTTWNPEDAEAPSGDSETDATQSSEDDVQWPATAQWPSGVEQP